MSNQKAVNLDEYKILLTSKGRTESGYIGVSDLFKVHRIRITPENIGKFVKEDTRVGTLVFLKEQSWLEKELVKFATGNNSKKDYKERYDITTFTFDADKEPWFLVDGSHRSEALVNIFKRKELEYFDAILIPDVLIPHKWNNNWEQLSKQNELLNEMLKKEGLPLWIKKHDILKTKDGDWIAWVNKLAIDTGGKDATMLSIPAYKQTRQQQSNA